MRPTKSSEILPAVTPDEPPGETAATHPWFVALLGDMVQEMCDERRQRVRAVADAESALRTAVAEVHGLLAACRLALPGLVAASRTRPLPAKDTAELRQEVRLVHQREERLAGDVTPVSALTVWVKIPEAHEDRPTVRYMYGGEFCRLRNALERVAGDLRLYLSQQPATEEASA